MRRILWVVLTGCALLAAGTANGQSTGEIKIYAQRHFRGPSIGLAGAMTHIDPPFTAWSIEITPGTAWEVCSGNTFSGCRRIDKSVEYGAFSIRSVRPIAPVIVTRIAGSPTGSGTGAGSPPNLSLRGLDSEFFVAPNRGGQRVSVIGTSPELTRRAADEFCRNAGWRMSVHSRLQSDGGTYYLVDVLCANVE